MRDREISRATDREKEREGARVRERETDIEREGARDRDQRGRSGLLPCTTGMPKTCLYFVGVIL